MKIKKQTLVLNKNKNKKMINQVINRNQFQSFPYHLVDPSPWPILVSFSLLSFTVGAVVYMQGYPYGNYLISLGFHITLFAMILWFRDIITEGTFLGNHTIEVQKGLTLGIVLFIISEVFAFLSVFWAFFHSSLSPAIELGGVWPPQGITPLDPFAIPLLNTILLLSSGVCQKCDLFEILLLTSNILPFNLPRVSSLKRIGCHNIDILSILIGSLLGKGNMERDGNGSRFTFYPQINNGEYLLWLHQIISTLGYSNSELPEINIIKEINGKISYKYKFKTYTYSSFNWIYDEFYPNNRKIIPTNIDKYLSPIALSYWIMADASLYKNRGLKFNSNHFTLKEIKILSSVLEKKYTINTSIYKTGIINQYSLYIPKSNLDLLRKIIKPYIHPTMIYKIILI